MEYKSQKNRNRKTNEQAEDADGQCIPYYYKPASAAEKEPEIT